MDQSSQRVTIGQCQQVVTCNVNGLFVQHENVLCFNVSPRHFEIWFFHSDNHKLCTSLDQCFVGILHVCLLVVAPLVPRAHVVHIHSTIIAYHHHPVSYLWDMVRQQPIIHIQVPNESHNLVVHSHVLLP